MAFAFNQGGGNAPSINVGAELTEFTAECLGFSSLGGPSSSGGAKKLKFLPTPWPKDKLPPSAASLLSVASRRGLIAAAAPDSLVIASTDATREAFKGEADADGVIAGETGEDGVITPFTPEVTISTPQLRHVAFSSNEDFLVITAESGGGLAVYGTDDARQKKDPAVQISTDQTPVRALIPNPNTESEQYFAAVLESGRLIIADVAMGQVRTMHEENVTCVGWSNKGKALIAGLKDGTALQYKIDGSLMATVPRPPEVDESYVASAVYWLNMDEFLIIHSPGASSSANEDAMEDFQDSIYHLVKTDKARTSFSFHRSPMDPLFVSPDLEKRDRPPRYSITRLRTWQPDLDDMLILCGSNSADISILTSTSASISAEQQVTNEFAITMLSDNRRPLLPPVVNDDGGDSALIGDAVDLSSKEKVTRPIPMDDEYNESPTPLPAFLALNHQGLLSAWWVVYDKSIREGTGYPGLIALAKDKPTTPVSSATPSALQMGQSSSGFSKPTATFGAPTPATPSFGGKSSQTSTTFGSPSQPASGQTAFGKPAFGAASAIGASSVTGFGTPSAWGKNQSPWGSASQTPTSQGQQNPFANQAGAPSGFAKFGGTNNAGSGSAFSSFGSTSGQSPFKSLGGQKSAFVGTSNEATGFKGLSTNPSFGSTVTVGSSFGDGSTLPSWANTPAQQGGSGFGQPTSSFGSSKESDMSDADDARNRERDEATPTPQAPPQQPKNLFGIPTNGFQLNSSFRGDGSAKDDVPKPAAPAGGSLFGDDFASALGGTSSKPPATPIKKEEEEPRLEDISTTPASPPKPPPSSLFPSATPAKEPPRQRKAPTPSTDEESPVGDDAPLPPDPMTWKPPKKADDDLPPLAGSPAIKVEAPESDVPSSPLDDKSDKEDDFSVEEQDGDDEEEEPSPSDAARRSRPEKTRWAFQDSVNQSPQIRPAAPTPPAVKSGTSSQSGEQSRGMSPARPALFGQASKPSSSSMFPTSAAPTGFPKPPTSFQPTASRAHENLRSPSPVRAASTSAIGARRQQMFPQGASLSSSVQQQSKPPTPQPEVSDLSDDENERIQQELASEIVPSRELDTFLAHQDYTGAVTKTGTAAQIEIVYRDMNSMVDTLGLNARSLASFVAYHNNRRALSRSDLEAVNDQSEEGAWFDNWCLSEIRDLRALEDNLEKELDAGRVQSVLDKLGQLARLLNDKAKLLTKLNDIRRQIINRRDPERADVLRKASLPKELADQQKALRNEYARLLTLLGQAEEAAFLLKSKLASNNAVNGKTMAVPTVDAVKKTINRLIQMTEKKNNDILLLESQLRKLNIEGSRPNSSSSRTFGTPSRSSRALVKDQSPLATPPTNRSRMSLSELNRTVQTPEPEETPLRGFGLFYTPVGSPTGNPSGALLKLANDMENNDLTPLREANQRRKNVAGALATALSKRGVKVTNVSQ